MPTSCQDDLSFRAREFFVNCATWQNDPAGGAIYRWMIARFARWALTEAGTGRPGPALRSMADDIRFVFPGSSSLACDVLGKDHVAAWLRRLTAALGPDYRVLDVVVSGLPGNTRAAMRFRDTVEVHTNEGMHYLRL